VIITKLQVHVAPVELDVSSESSCALRLARHSQMHGLDTSNVSSRVESSQVEFEPNSSLVVTYQAVSYFMFCAVIALNYNSMQQKWETISTSSRLQSVTSLELVALRAIFTLKKYMPTA